MIEQFIFLPPSISTLALIVLLVAGIAEFRKGHIGRVAIFANSMLLWQFFFDKFIALPGLIQWYLNIGTAIGLIALGAYLIKERLPAEFYDIAFVLYGSISVLIVLGSILLGFVQL